MTKNFIRRWVPDAEKLSKTPGLGRLGNRLRDHPHLFHLNRHSVSYAFLVGLFFAYVPAPGQAFMAAAGAVILRANLPIALALVWISNPFTLPFFVLSAYSAGAFVLGAPAIELPNELSWHWVKSLGNLIWPFAVGSFIMGAAAGLLGFMMVQGLWRWGVLRRWGQRRQRLSSKP